MDELREALVLLLKMQVDLNRWADKFLIAMGADECALSAFFEDNFDNWHFVMDAIGLPREFELDAEEIEYLKDAGPCFVEIGRDVFIGDFFELYRQEDDSRLACEIHLDKMIEEANKYAD